MEAHSPGPQYLYDQAKQQLRIQTDRPDALREAIYSCRKGGIVFALGVFVGLIDKFPMGVLRQGSAPLETENVASAVLYAVEQPERVRVEEILVRSTEQPK